MTRKQILLKLMEDKNIGFNSNKNQMKHPHTYQNVTGFSEPQELVQFCQVNLINDKE